MGDKIVMSTRNRLIDVVQEQLGYDVSYMVEQGESVSDLALIVKALEDICDRLERLDSHSHTIT